MLILISFEEKAAVRMPRVPSHFSVIFSSTSPVFRNRLFVPMKDMERGAETSVPS